MTRYIVVLLLLLSSGCVLAQKSEAAFIEVLGISQDGGFPHMGCQKQCCARAWKNPGMRRNVVSLALVDPATKQWWLFEATPDIRQELHDFQQLTNGQYSF